MPANAAVQQFIQAQLATGKSVAEIKVALATQGWDATVITDSLAAAQSGAPLPATANATVAQVSQGTSGGMTALTIVLLLIVPLIGVIVMWTSTQWSKGVKWLLTVLFIILPIIGIFLILVAAGALVAINPQKQFDRANSVSAVSEATNILSAAERYNSANGMYPNSLEDLVASGEIKDAAIDDVGAATYSLTSVDGGEDCELVVTVTGHDPVAITCSNPDLSELQILNKTE